VGSLCYQKKLHDLVFSGDICVGDKLKNVRVTVVASRSGGFTPWRRATQTHFDLRKEVVKLKVKSFLLLDNTYEKYYIDIRENTNILSMGDLRKIAQREVAKLSRPTFSVNPAPANNTIHPVMPVAKNIHRTLAS